MSNSRYEGCKVSSDFSWIDMIYYAHQYPSTNIKKRKPSMDKKTLTSLFAESLYRIPDYQRGYAWEKKQWTDFIQDIDALVDEEVRSHYTGTIVVFANRDANPQPYG
ncbi:MAG: DUF262 domain-containing protein, partial [Chloroflexia bacterium]|nr:DUF262 domain-containing protein [Chloroflexia bacterium]